MKNDFDGRVAIVTGASSGIGWSLATILAAQGCKVGLVARRRDLLDQVAKQIHAAGGIAAVADADVADGLAVRTAIDSLREQLGPIDLMIANAGVGKPTSLKPVNLADVDQMFRVNTLGVVYCFAAVLPEMLARSSGHLVAISSIAAYRGLPGESAYCASKAAVNTYLDGLRIHLRGTGIDVTTICPGFVKTPMTEKETFPMPGLMEAGYAAHKIVRAIRNRRKVSSFPWWLAALTKASRWLPDWVMARTVQPQDATPPHAPETGTPSL